MRKELDYLNIEGHYGGDQEWFSYFSMRFGGCAAATACELLMYLAKSRADCRELYPYNDAEHITKTDYNAMGKRMRPYLKPRMGGISSLSIYIEGICQYLEQEAAWPGRLSFEGFDGHRDVREARAFIKEQIDRDMPVPYLLLKHSDPAFDEITWHWFLLTGYEESEAGFSVIYGTYGERYTADLAALWNTGYEERGGMLRVEVKE